MCVRLLRIHYSAPGDKSLNPSVFTCIPHVNANLCSWEVLSHVAITKLKVFINIMQRHKRQRVQTMES